MFYFRSLDANCEFRKIVRGVDLEVTRNGTTECIEIKGTADSEISWAKLKVSGVPCHEQLQRDFPLYRVVSVYDRAPRIHILKYSEDFEMQPEPRWALKPRRQT
jgi:hypothetical protein